MAQTKAESILKRALKKIEDPEHWVKGNMALNKQGQPVDVKSRSACCFCSAGALAAASPGNYLAPEREDARTALYLAVSRLYGYPGIVQFNDASKTRHSQVVRAFKKAIEYAHDRGL